MWPLQLFSKAEKNIDCIYTHPFVLCSECLVSFEEGLALSSSVVLLIGELGFD